MDPGIGPGDGIDEYAAPAPKWRPETLVAGAKGTLFGAARPLLLPNAMWLDAVVTSGDLQKVVDQLTPATIPLGERGHLFFDAPAEVSLVADRGARIRCHAKLLWPVLGIDVAVTIRSMTLLIVPSIELRDGERVIVFTPEVDALDLALLPDVGDAEVRAYINRELQERRIELPWNYRADARSPGSFAGVVSGGSCFRDSVRAGRPSR